MKDIQSQLDHRRINIKKVGVKTITYPITVRDKEKKQQQTIATVNMYVNLPHRFKGTHMSRFVEILNQFHGRIDLESFHLILGKMKEHLDAEASHMEIQFPYFLRNETDEEELTVRSYHCTMLGSLAVKESLRLRVEVPISLPISQRTRSALPRSMGHWGVAEVTVGLNTFMWIEDLILHIEESIGRELEHIAGEEQKTLSVETVTQSIGNRLGELKEIRDYRVNVENLCDDYSTFAILES